MRQEQRTYLKCVLENLKHIQEQIEGVLKDEEQKSLNLDSKGSASQIDEVMNNLQNAKDSLEDCILHLESGIEI